MQINIDTDKAWDMGGLALDWFSACPVRLLIPYAATAMLSAIPKARSEIRWFYDERRRGQIGEVPVVISPMLVIALAPIWIPVYIAWRVLRAGLGPIPK